MSKEKREYFIVNTVITELIEKTNFGDKFKTVFTCKSNNNTPRLCVIWADSDIKIGDFIEMKGFFSDSTFVAKSLFKITQ